MAKRAGLKSLSICNVDNSSIVRESDTSILARSHPMVEFFEMMVVTQLLALEISVRLGNDVDMPRNLAKSVTVE